ncbi:MAG: hypothetical protein A2Y25_06880 [Candidatus Melainabacteria bacterium GWF2_37_15]|nr:MAG: hypothetical protein A2Y25_06880 [Candidatus Melainabacteria bacterium GWF2_37_15]
MGKRVVGLLICLFACLLFVNNAKADVSDAETYTVTIPEAVTVVMAADATNFGAITSAQFGVADTNAHVITVGNGVVATSTSYITTNSTANTGARQFKITFAGGGGGSYSLADSGGIGVLTITNATSTASVDIKLTDETKAAYPELGDPAGTEVSFAVASPGASGYLNIAAVSSVPFDATSKKAPLNMLMDLDETTVTTADAAGDISFDMTLSVIGIN